jgi:hypothetical protein
VIGVINWDIRLIDYQNAQVILIGAREGKNVIKNEIGVEIEESAQSEIYSTNSK